MNYTKGKWEIKQTIDGNYHIEVEQKAIVQIWAFPEVEANAHLIAAAPDMYEALKLVVSQSRELMGLLLKHGQTDILDEVTIGRGMDRYGNESALCMADKALLKAEGKSC